MQGHSYRAVVTQAYGGLIKLEAVTNNDTLCCRHRAILSPFLLSHPLP